jgi:AraC-like DNA-binding protein
MALKPPAQTKMVRVGFREPLDPRHSTVIGAGFIFNKRPEGRIRGRITRDADYIIMYILAGQGIYEDPIHGRRAIQAGDAIVAFPGMAHSYWPEPLWDEAYLQMSGPIFSQLEVEGVLQRDTPVISPGLAPALKSSFTSLVEDFIREQPRANPLQTARIHLLLAQMCESHRAGGAGRRSLSFLERACALLETDLEREIDMASVAAKFRIGYERFRKLFAAETGVSPARYRILRRIDRAKTLLMEGRTPLKTIAEQLGYCDVYFFARQFKEVTGKTPGEFRRF